MGKNGFSEEEFIKIYKTYFPRVYNYVYYQVLNRAQADDLTSCIFLKIVEHLDSFDDSKAALSTWIFTIARRTLVDYYRKNKQYMDLDDFTDTLKLSLDFEDVYREYEQEMNGDLNLLISKLNDKEREVIYLRYFEGYNNRQIAEKTGMNASTVGTLHERALKKMLKYAESTGMELGDYL